MLDFAQTFRTVSDTEIRTRRELADLFLRQVPLASCTHMLFAFVMAMLVYQHLRLVSIWYWFGILCLASLSRMAGARWHSHHLSRLELPGLKRVETLHCIFAGVLGICWGMLPWVATLNAGPTLDTMFVAIIMGFIGGGISSMAPFSLAFPIFASLAMLPHAAKALWLNDGDVHMVGWITITTGTVAIIFFNRNTHRVLMDSIRLRMENEHLLEALRAEKTAVEEASRSKSLFLAGATHDLKHPINAMGLYLGYLKTQEVAKHETLTRVIPGLEVALKGMSSLLSRLLELARLEAGEYQLKLDTLSIQDIFSQCAAIATDKASAKGLRICFVRSSTSLSGDRTILQSILNNLVDNAIRYTHHGGVVIGIRRRGDTLALQVTDTGSGIAAELIPLLFDAYRRFDDTQHNTDGFGLGLALVKKQCDLAGYRIEVNSAPGKGSSFVVILGH